MISNATVLIDEAIEVNGLKILRLSDDATIWRGFWQAFPDRKGSALGWNPQRRRRAHYSWATPWRSGPFSGADRADERSGVDGPRERAPSLRLHCFGHVHGGYGTLEKDGILFVNAALMGLRGDINKAPAALRMNPIR